MFGLWHGARSDGWVFRVANCHLHLGCAFLDGGAKAEKDWLKPLLAPAIDDAAKRLRVSEDINSLFRAQAKGCRVAARGGTSTATARAQRTSGRSSRKCSRHACS